MSLMGSPQWGYATGSEFTIDQSLRSSKAGPQNLSFTPASSGHRQKWVFSCWVKRSQANVGTEILFSTPGDYIGWNSADKLNWAFNTESDGNLVSTQVFRDTGAWMHLLFVHDTTQSTASNRALVYLNGVRITDWNTETYPAEDRNGNFNHTNEHNLGEYQAYNEHGLEGYIAEVHFIDGENPEWFTANDGTVNANFNIYTFGEFGDYGEWKPIKVDLGADYGDNGFYLPFKQDYAVEGFSATAYKGTSARRYVGGVGFQPDLTLLRIRSGSGAWDTFDSFRGPALRLNTQATAAEVDEQVSLTAWKPDGFNIGSSGNSNHGSHRYIAYNWDMGDDTSTGFACALYTGDGVTGKGIGGIGFQPDLVWLKSRSHTYNNTVTDALLLAGGENRIDISNNEPFSTDNVFHSLDSDGFSVGTDNDSNANNATYVAWCWDMGGSTVTNTDGAISASVRANTTYGQSIVHYTGTGSNSTVGHGLDAAPTLVIGKSDTNGYGWYVYHHEIDGGVTHVLEMNADYVSSAQTNKYQGTAPSSTVVSLGNHGTNYSSAKQLLYCFHEVTGYSKFGSYTGTTNAIAITTGFRPAWIMVKRTDATADWLIFDTTRQPFGDSGGILDENVYANLSNAVGTNNDFVTLQATGFTVQGNDFGFCNASGGEYVYVAFAGGMDSRSTYNTTGTIPSRVKANPTYGQSVISWIGTGATGTVGTGLTSDAEFVIVKGRTTTDNWSASTTVIDGSVDGTYLNGDSAFEDWSARVDPSSATSNTLGVYDWDDGNKSTIQMMAYAWHSVTGYSKIGYYTGNGNGSAGPSVTTGFKPAFVVIKNTEANGNLWGVYDNTRNPTNRANLALAFNSNAAEADYPVVDFDANGFQIHNVYGFANDNNVKYFYMAFADKREYAYWLDQSGNNNDWKSENLTESDISVDSPTNNFCTFNTLDIDGSDNSISEGALRVYLANQGDAETSRGTMGVSSGKWYWEQYAESTTDDAGNFYVGIKAPEGDKYWIIRGSNGEHETTGGTQSTIAAVAWDVGDIVGVAVDLDNSKWWVSINGTFVGSPTAGTSPIHSDVSGTVLPTTQNANSSERHTFVANFGQDSSFAGLKTAQGNQDSGDIGDFYYTPPTGFKALCTANLPATITPSEHFNTVVYTGNGSTQDITTVGFQPDLTWIKNMSAADKHQIFDVIRGVTKTWSTKDSGAEETNDDTLTHFLSNGFTTGDDVVTNTNTESYVAWNWKMNGAGSTSHSQGTRDTTISANQDAGQSLMYWTGAGSGPYTLAHGLSKAPEFFMYKNVNDTSSPYVWTDRLTGSFVKTLYLNATSPETTSGTMDAVSSTLVTVPDGGATDSPNRLIAWAFHSVDGYSRFGSYEGNGNVNGPFVYLGFRPKYFMSKAIDDSDAWVIYDSVRGQRMDSNLRNYVIYADNDPGQAELAGGNTDFLSNGVKIRNNANVVNKNNDTYIYIAFAEAPFKYANAK